MLLKLLKRLPRLQPSSTRGQQAAPLPAFSPAYTDRLMYQSHQHISHVPVSPLQPPPPPAASDIVSRASNQSQNAQYIFYTGHGNYQRKSFDANDLSSQQQQQQHQPAPPPTYNDPINAFIQHQNYNNNSNNSFVNSRTQSHQQRPSTYVSNSSGPYINSNIPEAANNNNNVYNDFRFPSYR